MNGLQIHNANAYRSFPRTEKAGHLTNSGADYTCPCKVVTLATWIDKGFFLEEMYFRVLFHRLHGGFLGKLRDSLFLTSNLRRCHLTVYWLVEARLLWRGNIHCLQLRTAEAEGYEQRFFE